MTLSEIGRIIISVFGLIGIGYGAGKRRLFTTAPGDTLGEFVFAPPVPLVAWLNLFDTSCT